MEIIAELESDRRGCYAGAVGYFGYKVLALSYGGTLQLFGKKGATYAVPECGAAPTSSGTSWVRLSKPALKGTSALNVDRPMTLKAGDQIVVTTSSSLRRPSQLHRSITDGRPTT